MNIIYNGNSKYAVTKRSLVECLGKNMGRTAVLKAEGKAWYKWIKH